MWSLRSTLENDSNEVVDDEQAATASFDDDNSSEGALGRKVVASVDDLEPISGATSYTTSYESNTG